MVTEIKEDVRIGVLAIQRLALIHSPELTLQEKSSILTILANLLTPK